MTATMSAAAITTVKVRVRTDEVFMLAALTPSLPVVLRGMIELSRDCLDYFDPTLSESVSAC